MASKQANYYKATAGRYDSMHVRSGDEHLVALEYVAALLQVVRAKSVLDVGAGTGRSMRFLKKSRPELTVRGIEPIDELRQEAHLLGVQVDPGSGEALPFEDSSFDVVVATGVLHHVPRAELLVQEMMRVARTAVMISDNNRYGQSSVFRGLIKAALYKSRLWPAVVFVKTRGRGYGVSEGDGIYYSYSVFDSVHQLSEWADRTFVIPTSPKRATWVPSYFAHHGLLVALREPKSGWAEI